MCDKTISQQFILFHQKSYDSLTEVSMLRCSWISKTSAAQRKGRAGRVRPGVVFRLYSRARHADFSQFQTPEVLRTPLMELCLHTKVLQNMLC